MIEYAKKAQKRNEGEHKMKGFFRWFDNNAKMKRWMTIILIGIVLTCIGISKLMVAKTISFVGVGKVIVLFVVGFTMVIIGLVYSQKRVLEILVEDTDYRTDKDPKERNVKSLIFNKKIYDDGPNIVVIGGGSGLNTVLKGLKKYTSNITAIVTVSNYGQEKTESRKKLELLPIDDIKDSIIALANDEEMMSNLLNKELKNRNLIGLTFGDIFFATMKEQYGNFSEAVEKSKSVLNIVGKVLPVTLDEMQICAELANGTIIEKRDEIKNIVYDKVTKIERVFINPSNCTPAPGVLEAIKSADAIIIGPGSLYTNVIPNLLIKNVSKTIKESNAIKIYVSNIMTEPGQTDNYSLSEHIQAILDHAGKGVIDYCIYDSGEIIPEFIKIYNRRGQDVVEQDIQKSKELGVKLLEKNLSQIVGDNIRHNTEAVAESVIELICDDMKFKDEQNSTKYIMINTRLREEKKINKKANKKTNNKGSIKDKKAKTHNSYKKKKSKFSNKYKERIRSIQESEFKREQNLRLEQETKEKEKFLQNIDKESKKAKKK